MYVLILTKHSTRNF